MKRILLLPLFCVFLVGCFKIESVNNAKQEIPSPDGTKKIVLFCRDAGATTGFNTQMSVLGVKEKLPDDGGGNVFIIDNGEAKVAWKEDGGILVFLDRQCRVFKKEVSVGGVIIEYREQ